MADDTSQNNASQDATMLVMQVAPALVDSLKHWSAAYSRKQAPSPQQIMAQGLVIQKELVAQDVNASIAQLTDRMNNASPEDKLTKLYQLDGVALNGLQNIQYAMQGPLVTTPDGKLEHADPWPRENGSGSCRISMGDLGNAILSALNETANTTDPDAKAAQLISSAKKEIVKQCFYRDGPSFR